MKAQERDVLRRAAVEYSSVYKKWQVSGSVNCGKYEVDIERSKHETFDEAAKALKDKISEAVLYFDDLITDNNNQQ